MRLLKQPFKTAILLLRNPKLYLLLLVIVVGTILRLHTTKYDSILKKTRVARLHKDLEEWDRRAPIDHQEHNEEIKSALTSLSQRHVSLEKRDSVVVVNNDDLDVERLNGVQTNDSHHERALFEQRESIEYDRIRNDIKLIPKFVVNVIKTEGQKTNKNGTTARFTPDKYPFNVNLTQIVRQYDENGFADVTPINVFDYRYIINPHNTCSGSDAVRVLFIVKSAPHKTSKREIIRDTWADKKRFPWIRIVFSFGIPKEKEGLLDLQDESAKYQDIFLVNYKDNYYNLTLKTVSGLKWAVTHCRRAMYVVSVDDDIYVAPDLLLKYLDDLPARKAETFFSGHRLTGTMPIRDPSSKWYTPKTEYTFKNYPNYIFGGFVIMSMSTVRNFAIAAKYTKLFKFEDVYLGILAAKLGIKVIDNVFVNSGRAFTVSTSFKNTIASHYYGNPKDLRRAWDCHLSILDQHADKAVYCDYIGKRLEHLKSEINDIAKWMEFAKKNS
ncbi:beta-1,3-galactosyltransferase 1-like [Mizuhopecten yessoensis]|uniref:Hexosyltransferase n=1 Tax=Mizuhopecten yessoensis TaxID=6573 RepID=A0A210QF46_MIZYE|nr:beta-1,3-galactosyltransferase 1-like [Mizuhopecten yessoensis]OWF47372.1 Beta-1,3-galactosyltransferase brn [Mizuhopecten yessoensis]